MGSLDSFGKQIISRNRTNLQRPQFKFMVVWIVPTDFMKLIGDHSVKLKISQCVFVSVFTL